MLDFPTILSLFRNKFNRFNNTGARMSDSFYYMTLKLIRKRIFGVKTSRLCHLLRSVKIMEGITRHHLIFKTLVVYRFYFMAFYHSQT